VEAGATSHLVDTVHELLLIRPDELVVNGGTDQRGCGIADADQICSSPNLLLREAQLHFYDEREQVAHEGGIIKEVQHHGVDTPQIRSLSHGTFDPAFQQQFVGDPLFIEPDPLDRIIHAPSSQGIRDL
jgi:hypothetical protein